MSTTRTESGITSKIVSSCETLRARLFAQLFPLGDVVAGEDDSASPDAPRIRERRERGFDDARSAAMLERDRVRDDRTTLERGVDLLGEVRQRVRKRVVDRPSDRLSRVHPGELAELGVGADQPLLVVENRDRERDRLEKGVQARDLRPLLGDTVVVGGQGGITHLGRMVARSLSVNDLGAANGGNGEWIMENGPGRTSRSLMTLE